LHFFKGNRMKFLRWIKTSVAAFILTLLASASYADTFPNKPIRIIVPWAAGGSTDTLARVVAQRVTQTIGQVVIVENKPGAAGMIGTEFVAKSSADGYTIGIIELPHAIAPAVIAKVPYDLVADFTPVAFVGTSPLIFFVGATDKAKSISDLVNQAKASPGTIAIAHSGSGTVSHLAAELLQAKANVKFNLVPYKGSNPALIDVVSGQVSAHPATMASGIGFLKGGQVNAVAVASTKRLAALPATPTFGELGYSDYVVEQWWGFVAPAATPAPVLEALRKEFASALKHEMVRERMNTLSVDAVSMPPAEFKSFVQREITRWGKIAKEANVVAQ
jgi:tripartite-type tricarboxylate transporter receptor subunit TctC